MYRNSYSSVVAFLAPHPCSEERRMRDEMRKAEKEAEVSIGKAKLYDNFKHHRVRWSV